MKEQLLMLFETFLFIFESIFTNDLGVIVFSLNNDLKKKTVFTITWYWLSIVYILKTWLNTEYSVHLYFKLFFKT